MAEASMPGTTANSHTYGANCRLAPVSHLSNDNGMPPVVSHFFYSSLIPIDELSSGHRSSNTQDNKSLKRQFRPFGCGDNNALEKAWLGLASGVYYNEHRAVRDGQQGLVGQSTMLVQRRRSRVRMLALKHLELHAGLPPGPCSTHNSGELPTCCPALRSDISDVLQQAFCASMREAQPDLRAEALERDVLDTMRTLSTRNSNTSDFKPDKTFCVLSSKKRGATSPSRHAETDTVGKELGSSPRQLEVATSSPQDQELTKPARRLAHLPAKGVGISGKPFIRTEEDSTFTIPNLTVPCQNQQGSGQRSGDDPAESDGDAATSKSVQPRKLTESEPNTLDVVVGISRLHKVSLPTLLMKPIYWSPVNDVATVMRATWFYRDTLMPVAPLVANQLEAGYQELQPWTDTWRDELRCAVEVGSLGEEKVSHCLWPQDSKYFDSAREVPKPAISADLFCSAHCFRGDAAAQGSIDLACEGIPSNKERTNRAFKNYHVIYKDERIAFLLKPSLRPSAYYGRKPASKILKGLTVGIPVVRGFDPQAWGRIHGDRNAPIPVQQTPRVTKQPAQTNEPDGPETCDACNEEKDRDQVTDLVLVAHGIGQKFAERVESFHFTHAINGFRRAVNQEMRNPSIDHILHRDRNGVMILPLNWRMGLSLEDGGPLDHKSNEEAGHEPFGLKDIEPKTIPAIRSMISDVMFDIPFYMSHHKNKMIKALVFEANRVYRLWCQNNPGFTDRGRVHIIAHSLGSVMAVDILSRQPTVVPRMDLKRAEPETQFFEFDTTNLFLLGSPAGFFLLLERGALIPRRQRLKPGADPRDVIDNNIVSDAGRFGCLAVDNIYNILAKEDPIAYLLNGAVDATFASALKTAYVPSTSISILKSVGDAMRRVVPGFSLPVDPLVNDPERPSAVRLPSQVELEVHDFTREEIAEKRAFLLNDNGQIDWFLTSGSGPLEIQYLNMLSAHTSYWINPDFVRMLCLEIGRRPGREHSIPAMRAMKATRRFSLEK